MGILQLSEWQYLLHLGSWLLTVLCFGLPVAWRHLAAVCTLRSLLLPKDRGTEVLSTSQLPCQWSSNLPVLFPRIRWLYQTWGGGPEFLEGSELSTPKISNTYTSVWDHCNPVYIKITPWELNYLLAFNDSSMTVKEDWRGPAILARTFSETISGTSGWPRMWSCS